MGLPRREPVLVMGHSVDVVGLQHAMAARARCRRRRTCRSLPSRQVTLDDLDSEWRRKGATLSDKAAREEFGLTQDEIVRAVRGGELQYREGSMHGNPWLRLLRREVEALVRSKHGESHLKAHKAKAELARVNRELKLLKKQIAALEKRRSELITELGR